MRLSLLTILFLLALPVCAEPREIRVGLNHAPPYRIVENGEVSGLYVDILEQIAKRLDWKITYTEAPFRRVLWLMERGEVDLMLGPLPTEERRQYMDYAVAAFPPERKLFFYREDENRILKYADLYGKAIGVLRGSSYFPTFDNDSKLRKEEAVHYENLLRMLGQGHLDVVVAPELYARYTIERLGLDLKTSPYSVPGEPSWITISRKSPLMNEKQAVRDAVEIFKTEALYSDLLLKYGEDEQAFEIASPE